MPHIIAISAQKGGSGKTTTAVSLSHALSKLGKKVLLVDLDPQGHSSEHFGIIPDNLPHELSDVLDGSKRLTDIIIPGVRENLDLAPSNIKLGDMELTLVRVNFREQKLKRALDPILKRYDYVMLDCAPALGLLTVNALVAAHQVIIPLASDYFSMLGVSQLLKTVEQVKSEANPKLEVLGILPTQYKRTVHSREVVERIKAEMDGTVKVYPPVNESTKFREASGMGKTIFEVAPNVPGAQVYRQIAEEIANG